jgi:hypothetical protein
LSWTGFGAWLLLNNGSLRRFLQKAEALGFVEGRLLLDNILLGGFDGLGFAGDWLLATGLVGMAKRHLPYRG